MTKRAMLAVLCGVWMQACATTGATTTTAPTTQATRAPIRGEEFRVRVSPTTGAGDAYDAAMLFERANEAVRAGNCDEGLARYEQLIREFPDNVRVHTAWYNRGLCLQRMGRLSDAADAMRTAATTPRDPELSRDAQFRVMVLGERAQQPTWVVDASTAMLARTDLRVPERIEALARRAAAQLAQNALDEAERAAEQAIAAAPDRSTIDALGDDTYAAQARVVLGEVFRLRAAAVSYCIGDAGAEDAITRRVQLVTHAHVLYNDAIRVGNPDWAAASGFRIGEMYRDLYRAIVEAPAPDDWEERARAIYRRRTGERLRPLLQGALRSWEATLTMARRNGISDNEWVRRADAALADLRALVLGAPAERPAS